MNRIWLPLLISTFVAPLAVAAQSNDPNPFEPPAATPGPGPAVGDADLDALQFSGVSTIGDETSFNFSDPRTRKSFWVSLKGSSEGGFSVVSYDAAAEQVVVRHGSRTRPISLRKSVLVAAPVVIARPAAAPPITTAANAPRPSGGGVDEIKNPKTPEEIKQAEYEARMLVSDLLDISMQERARQRAIREAQTRGQAASPTGSPPVRR